MRRISEAWRRHLRLWSIPLAFCLVNALLVAVYYARFAGNVQALENVKDAELAKRADIERQKRNAHDFLQSVDDRHAMMTTLYEDYFSTEEKRVTAMIREAKSLARQAGLRPTAVSYPKQELPFGRLTQRRMVFPVEGTYSQLRTFMNFLELTDHFLTLEGISLGGNVVSMGREPTLGVSLKISSIFVTDEEDRASSSRASSSRASSGGRS